MSAAKNNRRTYGFVAKWFHWAMALLIMTLLVAGFLMVEMELSPTKIKIYGIHKAIGVIVLALAILRFSWRLYNLSPDLPAHMRRYQRWMAHMGHLALYGFMFVMPVSGWLMSSAAGFPVSFFGLFSLPNLVEKDKELMEIFKAIHGTSALILSALIILHIAAALVHHFYYNDNTLRKMLRL